MENKYKNNIFSIFNNKEVGDIFCCFTRSYDENHKNKNIIHLISSIAYISNSSSFSSISDFLNKKSEMESYNNKCFYIFVVLPFIKDNIGNASNFSFKTLNEGNGFVYFISIHDLIGFFNPSFNQNNLIKEIFGSRDLDFKDLESIYNNSLFIFKGLFWSSIILLFKVGGINISGGSSTNRHVLSTVDYQLMSNLELFIDNENLLKTELFNNYRSPVVSNSISLDFYNKFIKLNESLVENNSLIEVKHNSLTEFLNKNINKYFNNTEINDESKYKILLEIFKLNYTLIYDSLIKNIINNIEYDIKKLELDLVNLNGQLNSLEFKVEHDAHLFDTIYSSNKSKKLIKKERAEYIKNNGEKLNESNKLKIIDLSNKIKNIELKVSEKRESIVHLNKTLNNKTLNELIYLNGDSSIANTNEIRLSKYNNVNKNVSNYGKRYFSSTSYKLTEITNLNNSLSNKSVISKVEALNLNYGLSNDKSIYFSEIKQVLDSTNLKIEDKQLRIENLWFKILEENFKNYQQFLFKNNFLLYDKLKKSEETLNLMFKKNNLHTKFPIIADKLNSFSFLLLAYLYCIQSIRRDIGYTHSCQLLGLKILYNIFNQEYNQYFKNDNFNYPIEFENFKNNINLNSNEDIIKLGDFFINILTSFPSDIFERVFIKYDSYNENVNIKLKFNEQIIKELNPLLFIDPSNLPMLCVPNKWNDVTSGGYLLNKQMQTSIITGNKFHGHKMKYLKSVYNTVNYMNATPFRINKDILNYISNTKNISLLNSLFKGKSTIQNLTVFEVANLFKDQVFYIPMNVDWRGRIYTIPFDITYQGSDFSLSLLEFNKGEKLTIEGLKSLYIYGANIYNYNNISKDSFNNRIKWVEDNYKNILLMDDSFINKAENKLVFIAFCLTLRNLEKDPNFLVRLPVFLDATCSGIQHLAALIKEKDLGYYVNLSKQSELSKPQDIYSQLLIPINYEIQKLGRENTKFSNLANVSLNRKNVKKSIMTKTYNVGILGMKANLIESLIPINTKDKEKLYLVPTLNNDNVNLNFRELYKIAEIIYNIIYTEYPKLKSVYNYLIDLAKLLNKLNLPIIWVTPNGLRIKQKYHKSTQKSIAITLGGKSRKMVLREWSQNIDKRKQVNAFIPNFIHSLDASHIMKIIDYFIKNNLDYPVITVHDCFGTHPNKLFKLSEIVKNEFIDIYSNTNNLEALKDINIEFIKKNGYKIEKNQLGQELVLFEKSKLILPTIPTLGDLNLKDVKESKHFIT